MSPKQIVSEGLQARKNVRAAEARAEICKRMAAETRDEHFRDRMNHDSERNTWQREKESLEFRIELKDHLIDQQAKEMRELREWYRDTARIRCTLRLIKGVALFALLVIARDLNLMVPWLVNWMALATIFDLTCTVAQIPRIKKY